ncbi:MAG: 4Fe-4S binding protein [Prolixibacteraceae bacterium]|nr:4Fe-4S binding protein [Prolixibacteraceae bacterium]
MNDKISKQIGILYFSPTNTTKKICEAIASGMGENEPVDLNITTPEFRIKLISNQGSMLENIRHLVVGAPVYAGKLPVQFTECINKLNFKGKECITVVVYGNRDYGIAFRNIAERLIKTGCKVVAAGAFIGQHSYKDIIPVAVGRPDKNDLDLAFNFGKNSIKNSRYLDIKEIPVQLDWISKSKSYFKSVAVEYISENCTKCGLCAEHCPTGIIAPKTGDYISKKAKADCIACLACVFECNYKARIIEVNFINKLILRTHLKKASAQRLEPLVIFP